MSDRDNDAAGTEGLFDLSSLDLTRLVELVESSDITMLRVRSGGTEILIAKGGAIPDRDAPLRSSAMASAPPDPVASPPMVRPAEALPTGHDTAREEGLVAVCSTLVGTFYRSPQPGAPPYAQVGSSVEEGDTVGLVEAMKVFTALPASVRGVVERFLVEDLDVVGYGQEICLVRAATP